MVADTRANLIFNIIHALDDLEALNFDNVPIEEVKEIIKKQLDDYTIIQGKVLR